MLKIRYIFVVLGCTVLCASCTSSKNTAGTRWYHSFNARFNVYFNGEVAYETAWKAQVEGYEDNYSARLPMFVVNELAKEKTVPGGAFDRAIEKAVKAIKTHSIQTKPEWVAEKRNDPKYREWMGRTEFNPFLHNAWMLMARSQFFNGDFLEAASSFAYMARLYASQPEIALPARIWQARCYAAVGWFYEAEELFAKIDRESLPESVGKVYDTAYADFLVQQRRDAEAIPFLLSAIRAERNGVQRNRERFLLGQLYSGLGERELAYEAFGRVRGAYGMTFAAQIRRTEVYAGDRPERTVKRLRGMARSSKNKNFLDQVYYALGNVYLLVGDTAQAIRSYEQGVEKSVRQGVERALNQIRLGDIHFDARRFVKAQPNYAEALPLLKKEDEAWPRVSKRSAVLDELVVFAEAVELQDSLQRLSRMSGEEQMAVVQRIIADRRKQEAEAERKQAEADYETQREDLWAQQSMNSRVAPPRAPVVAPGEASGFYFYSPQVVAVGKTTFQQRWGRRKLEDDWRRKDKANPIFNALSEEDGEETAPESPETVPEAPEEGLEAPAPAAGVSADPYDPQFYLQQIPAGEEELAASDLIIADGLFRMAVVYKDGLDDEALAIETFDRLEARFPEHENRLEAYHHLYLIHLKAGRRELADGFKQRIRESFPESEWAVAMADPDYEYNLWRMDAVVDSLYQDTYRAYLEGDIERVRGNCVRAEQSYATSELMPKFLFLQALSYVPDGDAEELKLRLRGLIGRFPDADVSVLASEIMRGFQRGLLLSASGDHLLARGGLFTARFGGSEEEAAAMDSVLFSPERLVPHELLIVYPLHTIDEHLLTYTVASYNFGNFIHTDFDIERTQAGTTVGLLKVKGFRNWAEIMQYVRMIYEPEGYAPSLEQSVVVVPISQGNYDILIRGKTLEDYMQFFEEHFGQEAPQLVERWKWARLEEQKVSVEVAPEASVEPVLPEQPLPVLAEPEGEGSREAVELYDPEPRRVELETEVEAPDPVSEGIDRVAATLDEVSSDPVRGLRKLFTGLFGRKTENAIDAYAREQEEAEKERRKQLKQEKAAEDKALQAEAKQKERERQELLKQQEEEEKALLQAKKRQEEELAKKKKQDERAKAEERKRLKKEREDARKEKLKASREAQKLREKERQAKIKANRAARKQRGK